jgi:hypothetical protein
MHEPKLWIYGAVPEPVGGVSVFLSRLIMIAPEHLAGIVDPYFADVKMAIPIEHRRSLRPGWREKIRLMSSLKLVRDSPLMVNASRPEGLIALAPFITRRRARTALILHHGNLQKSLEKRPWLLPILKICLRNFGNIGCLSSSQAEFYGHIGIKQPRLQMLETYIPPFRTKNPVELSQLAESTLAWVRSQSTPVLIGSGYAYEYYQHDWGIDYLDQQEISRFGFAARYLICCYGPKTGYLEQLMKRIGDRPDVRLVHGLTPEEFDVVLGECNVYVRPTRTDSYGMATRDALQQGLSVVASNACERAVGCLTHDANDRASFFHAVDTILVTVPGGEKKNSDIESTSRINILDWIKELNLGTGKTPTPLSSSPNRYRTRTRGDTT